MGDPAAPSLPPVLAADLAGGTYPAVVNILLALLAREKTGEGAHLDIAMTDNLFMLMSWALGQGMLEGSWPKSGAERLTGGSARYHIYPTADGRHVAAAPLEDRFWKVFCELIELPEHLRDDEAAPEDTLSACRQIIASKPASEWRRTFYGQDCCCSIVQSLEEAMAYHSVHARGLFEHVVSNEEGDELPAIPVAIAPQFRGPKHEAEHAPALGANNDEYLG